MTSIVIGAGAVGTYIAQLLSAKDGEVSVVGRGQGIPSLTNGASIWICVKSYDLEGALRKVEKQLNPSHNLFLLTNGLGVYATAPQL